MTNFSCRHYGIVLRDESTFKATNLTCSWLNLLLAFPTAFANISLVIALLTSSDRTRPCQILLLNLAITDFLAGVFIMPIQCVVFRYISSSMNPCEFANVTTPVGYILGIASFMTVSMIAVERYINIFHPFFHLSKLSSQRTLIGIACLWLLSLSVILPSAISSEDRFLFGFSTILVVLGTILNVYTYTRILLRARKVRRQIQSEAARFGLQQRSARDKSLLRVGGLIVTTMAICYAPIASNSLLKVFNFDSKELDYMLCWAWTLAMANSLVNPIITCSFSPPVRRKIIKIWTCKMEFRVTEESWTVPSGNRVVKVRSA